ncbi:MAG: hypothetical protein R3C10_18915 [Pirellulales bacterium]
MKRFAQITILTTFAVLVISVTAETSQAQRISPRYFGETGHPGHDSSGHNDLDWLPGVVNAIGQGAYWANKIEQENQHNHWHHQPQSNWWNNNNQHQHHVQRPPQSRPSYFVEPRYESPRPTYRKVESEPIKLKPNEKPQEKILPVRDNVAPPNAGFNLIDQATLNLASEVVEDKAIESIDTLEEKLGPVAAVPGVKRT